MMTRRLIRTALVATLAVGACTADWDPAPWEVDLPSAAAISELRTATDCSDLVDAAPEARAGAPRRAGAREYRVARRRGGRGAGAGLRVLRD